MVRLTFETITLSEPCDLHCGLHPRAFFCKVHNDFERRFVPTSALVQTFLPNAAILPTTVDHGSETPHSARKPKKALPLRLVAGKIRSVPCTFTLLASELLVVVCSKRQYQRRGEKQGDVV